jgi:hypothetical protein
MMVKELTAMLPLCNFRRYLLSLMLAVAIVAPALAQQPRTFQYIYDDTGQIKKAIDTTTGECIVYSYDEVGNITAVDRRTNCLAPPTFQSITPGSAPNCFTVTGQNLLGATVITDISGATVTDVKSSDDGTKVNFCLSATEELCNRSGTATVTTGTGSFDVPVSATNTTKLTPDVLTSGSISVIGEQDRYCFDLTAPARVVLQARGIVSFGSGVEPCLELYTGSPAMPVPDGAACLGGDPFTTRLEVTLAAGTYFVLVRESGNDRAGDYNLILEPIVGGRLLTPGTPANDTITPLGDLDLFTFSLTATKQVTIQVTPSGIQPCIELFKGTPAQPVSGGSTCANGTAQLNLSLNPETYFVLISDNGTNNTGNYSVLLQIL